MMKKASCVSVLSPSLGRIPARASCRVYTWGVYTSEPLPRRDAKKKDEEERVVRRRGWGWREGGEEGRREEKRI